ncbi:hypothetical protein WA158_003741 [Blastocystis sp. Blastoise]
MYRHKSMFILYLFVAFESIDVVEYSNIYLINQTIVNNNKLLVHSKTHDDIIVQPNLRTESEFEQSSEKISIEPIEEHKESVIVSPKVNEIQKPKINEKKIQMQKVMLRHWTSIPGLKLIVFNNDPEWSDFCQSIGCIIVPEYRTNKFGTVFLNGLLKIISHDYHADFYGYVNSDIIIGRNLVEGLSYIQENWMKIGLKKSAALYSHRINVKQFDELMDPIDTFNVDTYLDTIEQQNGFFLPLAIDIFIFSASFFKTTVLPPLLIGRNAIDGVLMDFTFHHEQVSTIDISFAVACIHLTDSAGSFAGKNQKHLDNHLNRVKYGKKTDHESIRSCEYALYRYNDNSIDCLPVSIYDDEITAGEKKFLLSYVHDRHVVWYIRSNARDSLAGTNATVHYYAYDHWNLNAQRDNNTSNNIITAKLDYIYII